MFSAGFGKWLSVIIGKICFMESESKTNEIRKLTTRSDFWVESWKMTRYSVQFSRSVVSDSLRPHKLQHSRPPYPSPTPGVHSDSCPSSQWCHPAISSSLVPSPLAPNPSQHQSLFQLVNSKHEVAKVLEFQL